MGGYTSVKQPGRWKSVSLYQLVENAVILACVSGHAVVGEHVDGSPSTFSGVIRATGGCNSNISKSIFFN